MQTQVIIIERRGCKFCARVARAMHGQVVYKIIVVVYRGLCSVVLPVSLTRMEVPVLPAPALVELLQCTSSIHVLSAVHISGCLLHKAHLILP